MSSNLDLSDLSDEELMIQYSLGEYKAFEIIYQRYSAQAYGYLLNKLNHPSPAKDVLQTTFLKLHEKRALYDRRHSFRAWFFTILRNSLVDYFRKNLLSKNQVNIDLDDIPSEKIPNENLDLESTSLTTDQKNAIRLRYEDDLEFSQIAERLNQSTTNVRQLISRGLKKLRTQ